MLTMRVGRQNHLTDVPTLRSASPFRGSILLLCLCAGPVLQARNHVVVNGGERPFWNEVKKHFFGQGLYIHDNPAPFWMWSFASGYD